MRLKRYKSFWGMLGTREERVRRIADTRYDGSGRQNNLAYLGGQEQ